MEYWEEISLSERKTIMLGLLDTLLDYCRKHNLKVYLCGGTLLGAVRHSGYIPWDDDIDVMMPMDDYERLIELVEMDKLPEPYRFSTPKNNPHHMWPFLKMIDFRTVLVEPRVTRNRRKAQEDYYGVYIDIFPMYGLPNNRDDRLNFQKEMCALYHKFKRATREMGRNPKDSVLRYIIKRIVYCVYCIPYRLMGGKHYLKKIDALKHKYPLETAEMFGSASGITSGEKDHNDTSTLGEVVFLKFEDRDCPVLPIYESMLKNQYGDYMVLPPEDKRHIHPSYTMWRKDLG